MTDRFEPVRRRYLSLGTGELASAVVFAAAGLLLSQQLGARAAAALWCALVPLLVVLVEGGAYWLAARRWVGRAAMPWSLARFFDALRLANPLLLAAGLAGVVRWWPDDVSVAVFVLFVWAFGVVEHVNYFVVRLSYPAREWARRVARRRTPVLVRDVRRGLAVGR